MSFIRDIRASRITKFLMVHIIVCIAVGVYVLSKDPSVHAPFLPPYIVAIVQIFTESFAGAFLSLAQFVKGAFSGFSGAATMVLFAHPVPIPVVSGCLSLAAFLFASIGVKTYGKKMMYFVFLLTSLLFILGACTYYLDAANNSKPILGELKLVQPGR